MNGASRSRSASSAKPAATFALSFLGNNEKITRSISTRREAALERLLALPVLVQAFLGVSRQSGCALQRCHRCTQHQRFGDRGGTR